MILAKFLFFILIIQYIISIIGRSSAMYGSSFESRKFWLLTMIPVVGMLFILVRLFEKLWQGD